MSPTPGQQISSIKNQDFKIKMLHNNSRINTSKIKQRFSPSALAKNSSKKLNSYHQMIAECIARKPTVKLERIDENLINTLTTGDKVMADNCEKAGNREPVNSNRENSDSDNLVCVISDVRGDAIDIYDTNTSKHLNINKFLPNNQEVSTSSGFKSEEKFEINQCFVNLLETVETMADDKHPNVDGLSQNITPNNYVFEFSSKDSEDLSESELVIDTAEMKTRDFNIKEENDSSNDMDVHPFSKFSKIVSENKKSVDSSEENDAQVRLFSVKSPFPENEEILSEHKVPKLIIKQSRLPSTDIRAENVKCPGKFDIMHESLSTVNSQNREDKVFRGESSSKRSSEDYKNSSKSFKRRKYGEDSHLKHSEDKKKKKNKLVKIARMKYDSFLEESRIASELPGFNWLENKIKNSRHTLGSLSTCLKRCSGGSITFNKTNSQIRHQTDNQTIRLSDNQIDHQTDKDVPGLLEVKENEPNKVKECHIEENNGEIDSTSFMPHNHNGTHETRPSVFTNSNSVLHTLNTQENLKHSDKPNSFKSIEQEGKINSVVREVLHEILDKITFRKDEIDIEIIDVDNQRSIQEDTDKLPKKKREDKSPPISTNTLEDLESVNKTKSSDSGDSKNLHHLLENESHNKIASPKSVDLDTSKSSNEDLYDEIIDVVETDSITGDLKRSYQSSSVAKAPSVQNIPETSIQRPQLPRPISSPATWNMQTMMNDVEKCYFRPSSVDSHSSARNMYTKKMTPVINLAPELKDNSQKLRLNSLYKEQSYFNGKTREFSPNNVQLSPEINPSKIVRPNCKTPVLNLKENTRTESTPFRPQLRLTNDLNMKISQIMMNEALRNAEIYRRANEYVLIKPKTTTVPLSSTNTVQNLLKQNENNILPSSFITNSTCQTFETPSSPTCNGISAPPLIWDCSNLNPYKSHNEGLGPKVPNNSISKPYQSYSDRYSNRESFNMEKSDNVTLLPRNTVQSLPHHSATSVTSIRNEVSPRSNYPLITGASFTDHKLSERNNLSRIPENMHFSMPRYHSPNIKLANNSKMPLKNTPISSNNNYNSKPYCENTFMKNNSPVGYRKKENSYDKLNMNTMEHNGEVEILKTSLSSTPVRNSNPIESKMNNFFSERSNYDPNMEDLEEELKKYKHELYFLEQLAKKREIEKRKLLYLHEMKLAVVEKLKYKQRSMKMADEQAVNNTNPTEDSSKLLRMLRGPQIKSSEILQSSDFTIPIPTEHKDFENSLIKTPNTFIESPSGFMQYNASAQCSKGLRGADTNQSVIRSSSPLVRRPSTSYLSQNIDAQENKVRPITTSSNKNYNIHPTSLLINSKKDCTYFPQNPTQHPSQLHVINEYNCANNRKKEREREREREPNVTKPLNANRNSTLSLQSMKPVYQSVLPNSSMLNPKRHEGQTTNLFDKRLNNKYESSMRNSAFTGVYIPPETVAHDQRTRNILPSWDMEAFHRSSAINPDYHSLRENVIRYDGRVQAQAIPSRRPPSHLSNPINSSEDGSQIGQKNLKCKKCNRKAVFICSGCKKAWYCDPECQKQDWLDHYRQCK